MPPISLIKQIKSLPDKPGVYIFRDQRGNILYIGKAKNLKNRVSSYFRFKTGQNNQDEHAHIQPSPELESAKQIMVSRIDALETIIVTSEKEALILEAELIKRHRPPFNVIFIDDKSFVFIKFDFDHVWPDVYPTRRPVHAKKSRSLLFGPYPSARSAYTVLRLGKRLFPYCMKLPRQYPPKNPRGCFNWHIGRCPGPCMGKITPKEYEDMLRNMIPLFRGYFGELKQSLKKQMHAAALQKKFEIAAQCRDQIEALKTVSQEQNIVDTRRETYDVISTAWLASAAAINLFRIREGVLVDRVLFPLKHAAHTRDEELIQSFIEWHYATTADIPGLIITPVPISASVTAMRVLVPKRGKKYQLLHMGAENAKEELRKITTLSVFKESKTKEALRTLREILHLSRIPVRIEAFDISNIQGTNAVGAMTVMVDGKLKRSEYRSFTIRTVRGSNDVAMLAEMLDRRFARSVRLEGIEARRHEVSGFSKTNKLTSLVPQNLSASKSSPWPLPDLIIIDGGKPQLSKVRAIRDKYRLNIPLLGIGKGRGLETQRRRARGEEIWYIPDNAKEPQLIASLAKQTPTLQLLDLLRDEAHRRGITHYRKKHRESLLRGSAS